MKKILAFLMVMVPSAVWGAAGNVNLISSTGLAYSTAPSVNLNAFINNGPTAKIGTTVTFSSAQFSNATFTEGVASTGNITIGAGLGAMLAQSATDQLTVAATSVLLGVPATAQFTVIVTTGLGSGATSQLTLNTNSIPTAMNVTLNGLASVTLQNGIQWTTGAASSNTAVSLANAIDVVTPLTDIVASTGGASVIYCTSTLTGLGSNAFTITVTSQPAISTTSFSGAVANAYLNVAGIILTNGNQWTSQTSASATALSIANAINQYVTGYVDVVSTAPTGSTVVYTTASVVGTAGNLYISSSSVPGSINPSSWTFLGGINPIPQNMWISVNGIQYYNGSGWTEQTTSSMTAQSIATFLNGFNNPQSPFYGIMTATATSNSVVYATATVGSIGNTYTFGTSNPVYISTTTPNFAGGQDNAALTINGQKFTATVSYSTAATASAWATNLMAAINGNLNVGVTTYASAGVVYATATAVGVNYLMATSTQAALSLSGPITLTVGGGATAPMYGGVASSITLNSPVIRVASHGFTTALQVLYSTTTGNNIAPLVNGTTYYIVVVDANDVELSSTSVVALSGVGIPLTSTTTSTTSATFTLAPLSWVQGSAAANWQVSNDGTNWANFTTTAQNVAVASNTFTAVFPSTTTAQDFGPVDYNYLRFNLTGPTQGGINLKVIVSGKD